MLYNSLGRYEEALAAAQQASEDSPAVHFASWALVELIEAAVRAAVPGRAGGALQRLSDIVRACGTDWVLGGRGPLAGAGQRRRGRRETVPRGDRPLRPRPPAGGPGPPPPGLRRVAAPPAAPA